MARNRVTFFPSKHAGYIPLRIPEFPQVQDDEFSDFDVINGAIGWDPRPRTVRKQAKLATIQERSLRESETGKPEASTVKGIFWKPVSNVNQPVTYHSVTQKKESNGRGHKNHYPSLAEAGIWAFYWHTQIV
jgi:hypothetical protein